MPKKATEAKSNAAAPAPAPEKEADVPSSKATSAAPAPVPRSQTKPKPAPADEMHLSAERGDVGRLAELLSVPGADIDAAAHGGLTSLMCCASKGRCGAARLMLRFGATIAATDESGFTALHSEIELNAACDDQREHVGGVCQRYRRVALPLSCTCACTQL